MTNRLELTWVGKECRPRAEPRILLEDPEKSYHAPARVSKNDIFDNILIHGDNLLALRSLEQDFANQIKCIYIDPPYNTGAAFAQYDDGIEHSLWLGIIRDRLECLHRLLSEEGSLWISLDDSEAHYCKVLCDELFGRTNFIADVIWEKADSPRMDAEHFSTRHEHILVYAKNRERLRLNRGKSTEEVPDHYDKVDSSGRRYYLKPLRAMGGEDAREDRESMYFPLFAPDGSKVFPIRKDGSDGRWRWGEEKVRSQATRIEWIKGRKGWVPYFRIYAESVYSGDEDAARPPETLWSHTEVGTYRTSKAEVKALFGGAKLFDTPKPEKLMQRIVELATSPGDIVLDSFAGSGTTGAAAHKLGRRWIMVELGEHCDTLIVPRMRRVVDGTDQGGVTKAVSWKGGGGFRFYKLAPSLLAKDEFGNWVVNKQYNSAMLAEAVCKLEGYRYAPSSEVYWQHGHSSEDSFIYVTTQTLLVEQLRRLNEEVGPKRSLLICCGSFTAKNLSDFPHLTVKKIPKAVLHRCEWGHDDYSLEIRKLPETPAASPPSTHSNVPSPKESRRRTVTLLSYGET